MAMRLLHALPLSKLQDLTESDPHPESGPLEEVGIQIVEIMIRNRKRKTRKVNRLSAPTERRWRGCPECGSPEGCGHLENCSET